MKKTLLYTLVLFTITLQGQNKIESALEEFYNGTSWINSYGYNYEYDINNNLTSQTEYSWSGTSWGENYKSIYTYNTNNTASLLIEQNWNGTQFVDDYRNTYTYNSNSDITQFLSQDWNGSQWVNSYQGTITYNNNLLSVGTFADWNGTQWVNEERITRTYSSNSVTEELSEEWDGTQWLTDYRELFTYNSNSQITLVVSEVWDGSAWSEEERITYELDTNGNRTREIENYNGGIQSKTEYSYDAAAQLSDFAHPFKDKTGFDYLYEDFPYVNKILSSTRYSYDGSTSTYNISGKTTYNYNDPLTLSLENFEQAQKVKLYPNPSSNFFKITGLTKAEKITVYSVLGTKALETIVNINEKINIQNLSNGLYFLKLENGNTIKFLKK